MSRKPKIVATNVRQRTRRPQDPVLLTDCNYCTNGFWYKASMGLRVFNGREERLRIQCGWCDKYNYVDPPKGD